MCVDGGAFASSLNADSEGEEGKFYLWTQGQIETVLGSDAEDLLKIYELASPAGWDGDPILHRLQHANALSQAEEQRLRRHLDRLLLEREKRPRPGRDDKVLVDWNGITIAALANAGRQFDRADWVASGQAAFRFVCDSMNDGRLPHSIRGTKRLFPALASDYAAMISAAVGLYSASREDALIEQALAWAEQLERWYADGEEGGYFLTASDAQDVPMRIRGDIDEAIPSATAQIISALVQLSTLTGDHDLHERAVRAAEAALGRMQNQPYRQAGLICAAALAQHPMKLLINDPSGDKFVPVANRRADPRRIDILLGTKETPAEKQLDLRIDRTRPGAWICYGQSCLPPIYNADDLETELRYPRQQPFEAWKA